MKTIAAFALLLAGCASINAPQMSAEQLKAFAADKSMSAICTTGTGVWGTVTNVYVNWDKSALQNGGVSVDPRNSCALTVTNEIPVKGGAVAVPAK